MGTRFNAYRPPGRFGQYDGSQATGATDVLSFFNGGTDLRASRPRFIYSTNLNPRFGRKMDKYPVRLGDVAAGAFDHLIIPRLKEVAAYGGPVFGENYSEANVRKDVPSAQPAVPDPESFQAAHLHLVALSALHAPNLEWTVSLAGPGPWVGADPPADTFYTPAILDTISTISVDQYSHAARQRHPSDMFTPPWEYAQAHDKLLAITEVGCAEADDGGATKALFFKNFLTWLDGRAGVKLVVLNHGAGGGDGGYALDSTPAALGAATDLVAAFA
jgi:hypothetical protein